MIMSYHKSEDMPKILIGEAAKILGVSKRTLIRWDKAGKLVAGRNPKTNVRLFDLHDMKLRAHLRKLPSIQARVQQYAATIPLNPLEPLKPRPSSKLEDMKRAFEDRREWEKEWWKLLREQK